MKFILALCLFVGGGLLYFMRGEPNPPPAPVPPTPERVKERGLDEPVKKPRIVVHRSAREMELFDGDILVKRYRVAVGSSLDGDKEKEGDKRTPLGEFYVCTRNPESRFHRFLGISYPTPEDADRGLRSGMIRRSEHDTILAAHKKRRCPPWKTALGGEVGIHGGGSDRPGTLGCVGVSNPEIEELWSILSLGDPVIIKE